MRRRGGKVVGEYTLIQLWKTPERGKQRILKTLVGKHHVQCKQDSSKLVVSSLSVHVR